METCSVCGAQLTANQVLYTPQAKVICNACNNKSDLVDTDKRAAGNIVKSATGALMFGIVSVPVLIFLASVAGSLPALGTIAGSIVAGIVAILGMSRKNERFNKHLSDGQTLYIWIATVVGWTFCLLTLILVLFVGIVRWS